MRWNGVVHFTTSRKQGNARKAALRRQILKTRRLPGAIATAEQVHGCKVVVVPSLRRARRFRSADGLITRVPNQPLGIFSADCLPVFVWAPRCPAVGLLHAGWQGLRQGILGVALKVLRRRWEVAPRDVFLRLGPGVCRNCFNVRWNVARHFPLSRRVKGKGWQVDLAGELVRQARRQGVPASHIQLTDACTRHGRHFYSYRRERTAARQISVIMLQARNQHGFS